MQAGTFEYANGVLGATVATQLGIVTGTQRYNRMAFTISGISTEGISCYISYDYNDTGASGTFGAVAIRPTNMATGAVITVDTMGNGNYILVNTPWRAVKFVKAAATESATLRWATLNAN